MSFKTLPLSLISQNTSLLSFSSWSDRTRRRFCSWSCFILSLSWFLLLCEWAMCELVRLSSTDSHFFSNLEFFFKSDFLWSRQKLHLSRLSSLISSVHFNDLIVLLYSAPMSPSLNATFWKVEVQMGTPSDTRDWNWSSQLPGQIRQFLNFSTTVLTSFPVNSFFGSPNQNSWSMEIGFLCTKRDMLRSQRIDNANLIPGLSLSYKHVSRITLLLSE